MAAVVENMVGTAADAVSGLTTAVGNVSLDGNKDEVKDGAHASAAEGRRLYIGNLAYATTEQQLKESFDGFSVESVAIPKNPRTDRPVGYAFVDLSTSSEAERAIAELSGKEILERKVSVQLARTPSTSVEKAERNGDNSEGGRRRPSTRGRGRGRARSGRGGYAGGSDGAKEHASGRDGAAGNSGTKEVKPLSDITNQKPADRTNKAEDKFGVSRRERGPPTDGVPSKTKVMVANLPYDLTEDKLKELFSAYQPSSAKIALRPIPRFMAKKLQARGEARKGRGFGFITLASQELQQKAVAEMNGKIIGDREIAVKVAIDSPDKMDAEDGASHTVFPAQSDKVAAFRDNTGAHESAALAGNKTEIHA